MIPQTGGPAEGHPYKTITGLLLCGRLWPSVATPRLRIEAILQMCFRLDFDQFHAS